MAVATSPPRPASRATPGLRGTVLALFVASGAAGLIYQVVWSRELVLVFGNTTQAVATIVTAFMAGLGFGSLVGGRLADTSARPLRLYGLVELAVATMAAVAPLAFHGLAEVYRGVWPSLVERPGQLAGVRFGLAVAAVAPATFLMGMTLPLLTRYLVRTLDEAGARLGELYAANTIGAMAGTLLGGFVLIELLGLRLTSYLAVVLNVVAGAGALLLSRRWETGPDPSEAPAADRVRPDVRECDVQRCAGRMRDPQHVDGGDELAGVPEGDVGRAGRRAGRSARRRGSWATRAPTSRSNGAASRSSARSRTTRSATRSPRRSASAWARPPTGSSAGRRGTWTSSTSSAAL